MPNKIELDPRDMRALERIQARLDRNQRGGVWNTILDDTKGRALMGQFAAFGVPFYDQIKEQWYLLENDCFGDLSKQIVEFQFAHNPATKAGDTTNALELYQDGRFWFDLDKAENGRGPLIATLCASGAASSISIGATLMETRVENVDGEKVIVVTKAKLNEISQVSDGMAGDNAFAVVVDAENTQKPSDEIRSDVYDLHHRFHRLALSKRTETEDSRCRPESKVRIHVVSICSVAVRTVRRSCRRDGAPSLPLLKRDCRVMTGRPALGNGRVDLVFGSFKKEKID